MYVLVLPFNNYFLLLSPSTSSRRITCIKTKARNRLQLSIIRIRAELLSSNKCCKEFVSLTKILNRFKADILYSKTGVCKLRPAGQMRPASENCAARGELRFLNRVRPANVSHVFWRCLIKSMSEINLE